VSRIPLFFLLSSALGSDRLSSSVVDSHSQDWAGSWDEKPRCLRRVRVGLARELISGRRIGIHFELRYGLASSIDTTERLGFEGRERRFRVLRSSNLLVTLVAPGTVSLSFLPPPLETRKAEYIHTRSFRKRGSAASILSNIETGACDLPPVEFSPCLVPKVSR